MNSIEKPSNEFANQERGRGVAQELLSNIPEHQRQQLIDDTMRMLHKDAYRGISEDTKEKLEEIERRYYKRGYGGFKAGELLRAVMDFYMYDEMYVEQQSAQLIAMYQIWLKENGYKTSFLSDGEYEELEERALDLVKSGEPNVMMALRAEGLSAKIAPDDTLQEIINNSYNNYANSF